MSKISADTVEAKTTNGDLVLQGNGTGVPDLASGTKLNGTALTDTFSTQSPVGANLIINGDMRIDQRDSAGTPVTATASGPYAVDRFRGFSNGVGVFTLAQDTDVPSGEQFTTSIKADVGTIDATIGATDFYSISHVIEGLNTAHLLIGTANAQTVTLRFWVKSPKTGTHYVAFINNGNDRSYPASYTVSVADTWEEKSITLTMDTTGTWLTTNGKGISLFWVLAIGSNFEGTADAWQAGNIQAASGHPNCMDNTANNFYLTGVKLEVGSTATDFVPDDYATSLAKCRRYYQIIGGAVNAFAYKWYQTTNGYLQQTLTLAAAMRAIPTLTKNGTWNTTNCGQPFFSSSHPGTIWFQSQTTSTGASGLYTDSTDDTVEMDAEL